MTVTRTVLKHAGKTLMVFIINGLILSTIKRGRVAVGHTTARIKTAQGKRRERAMASVKDFIEAGREYKTQVAASNPIITTKPPAIWFQEIADKLEVDMALSELTREYNLNLVEGEDPMTEKEMAEIMEMSEVEERSCWECYHCMGEDPENEFLVLCLVNADGASRRGPESVVSEAAKRCGGFRQKPKSEEEMAEIMEVSEVEEQKAQEANRAIAAEAQKPKYCDWDMMLKDDEIAILKQRVDTLENEIEYVCRLYGINWNIVREARDNENRRKETPGSM